jgi:hypothetical protein
VAAIDPSALPARRRGRARAALGAPSTLVDGSFVPYANAAFPQLAALGALDVWVARGADGWAGNVYRVTDTGIVCIRAPCFSLRATVVNTTRTIKLSEIDLEGASASAIAIERARALLSHGGVLVAGTVRRVSVPGAPDTGRALVASQLWLPA